MRSSQRDALASEHRLEVLLGCTKGIVFEFDREGRYLHLWTHDEALLVQPREQMIGRTIEDVMGVEGRKFLDALRRVYETGKSETLEYELVVQGGQRWFSADVVVSPSIAGRDRTIVYLIRDITAHKQLEEQLRQAQKLEAIGRLAGGIAHDFNNILTTIMGYSEMLMTGLADDTRHHEHASRIRHAAGRAAALTNQLLAYGRKQLLVPEVLDVNAVISTTAHMLGRVIGEHIELSTELARALGGVQMDRSGLEQVIMNLSLNARDALAGGGRLILRTEEIELDDAVARPLELAPGRHVRITVSDNGHGMDAATAAQIFDPFFTTKSLGKGTGLGLSTVYGIVKQSGGHVTVESTPGHGASFHVYLPVLDERPPSAVVKPERPAEPVASYHVLVVEDDPDVGRLALRYLSEAGYRVELTDDAEHALEIAGQRAFDLLVTDLVMPRLGGGELAQRVTEMQPQIRVLYISGYPANNHPRVPDSVFLQKPFTRRSLVREVGALFERDRLPAPG